MAIMRISSAGAFEAKIAYCHAVFYGGFVPVAGPDVPDGFVVQSKSAPRINERALSMTGVILVVVNQMKHVFAKIY